MKTLWQLLKGHPLLIALILGTIPISTILQSVQPYLIKMMIDGPIKEGNKDQILMMSGQYFLAVLGAFLINAIGTSSLQWVSIKSLAELKTLIFKHIIHQGQAFFDQRSSGMLLSRNTQDVDAIYESLSAGVVGFLSDALLIIGTFGMLIYLDPMLTLIAFSILPIMIYLINICRKKIGFYFQEIRKINGELNGDFNEQLNGMNTIQNYSAQDRNRNKLDDKSSKYAIAYQKSNWWDASLYAMTDGMSTISIALVLSYCAYLMGRDLNTSISLGAIVALIDGINRIYVPIREFSGKLAALQRSKTALDRIDELLAVDQKVKFGNQTIAKAGGHIAFQDLSFQYAPQGHMVLDHLNFQIKPGEIIALVGSTGSGKTTISKLLLRNYEFEKGNILFDDVDIRHLSEDFLRKEICVVHQDAYLFKGSIRDNIKLWQDDLSDEQILKAVEQARLDQLIRQQSQSSTQSNDLYSILDHHCQANGGNLSVGQQQLISLARVFARNPSLVILDEATASVDSLTENLIDEAVAELFKSKTVLVIAHRLSTIKKADRILVLENGKIVEQGTHTELIQLAGTYQKLIDQKH
jgi:ATP-binding cassette subfamily B multidrug efflux pump